MYYYTITFTKLQVYFKNFYQFSYFFKLPNRKNHSVIYIIKIIHYLATNAPANNGSTLIPGPIVNEIATVLKYCPFEVAGFNLII